VIELAVLSTVYGQPHSTRGGLTGVPADLRLRSTELLHNPSGRERFLTCQPPSCLHPIDERAGQLPFEGEDLGGGDQPPRLIVQVE
jgi:hypothetical protein